MLAAQGEHLFTIVEVLKLGSKKVWASSKEEVLDKHGDSVVIIAGTLGSIGGRRISSAKTPDFIDWSDAMTLPLKAGSICALIIDDPVTIPNATYIAMETINDEEWVAFEKNGVSFWAWKDSIGISRVNGKTVRYIS